MSETFKCCNCGFVCEIINSESLDMGIAECEKCGTKGLRRQNVSFVDSFRKVITMIDPQANSSMSKDMPPPVKIFADWGRKACDELEQLQADLATAEERIKKMSKGDLGPESILSGYSVLVKSLEKRRDELRDSLTTAREENKRLREFARFVIRQECWSIFEQDGLEIQDLAEKLGLIVPHIVAVDDDYDIDNAVGDTIFIFSDTLEESDHA